MTPYQQQQAQKILSMYNLPDLQKSDTDENDIEKARGKVTPIGSLSKNGREIKTADGWKPVKTHGHLANEKEGGDDEKSKKRIKVNSPLLMSHSKLHGKEFDVEKVREVYMGSGPMKVYHVKDENGKEHEINEQFVEHIEDKKK